jgi:integrase
MLHAGSGEEALSVNALALAYYKHASEYYAFGTDRTRGDRYCLRGALGVLRRLYGRAPAHEFGPKALKACRAEMVRRDWARTYVNAQIDRIKRVFRWGAEEELVAGELYQALRAVSGLRRGKCEARETERVKPIPQEYVDAALPFIPPVVQAMVRLQQLTGCRPAEVCLLRPANLDMTVSSCWVFRPAQHKTQIHEHDRIILIGPRAQAILRPYLGTCLDAYCFSPAESERKRHAARRQKRKSPLTPSQGTFDPATGIWNVGTLTVGATAMLTVTAQVDVLGPIINTAHAGAIEIDPDLSNNDSTAPLTGLMPPPDISKRFFLSGGATTDVIDVPALSLASVPTPIAAATLTTTVPDVSRVLAPLVTTAAPTAAPMSTMTTTVVPTAVVPTTNPAEVIPVAAAGPGLLVGGGGDTPDTGDVGPKPLPTGLTSLLSDPGECSALDQYLASWGRNAAIGEMGPESWRLSGFVSNAATNLAALDGVWNEPVQGESILRAVAELM